MVSPALPPTSLPPTALPPPEAFEQQVIVEALEKARDEDQRKVLERNALPYDEIAIVKELGRGTFGVAYLGRLWGEDVVLKRLPNGRIDKEHIEDLITGCRSVDCLCSG